MSAFAGDGPPSQTARHAQVIIALVLVVSVVELRHAIARLPEHAALARFWLTSDGYDQPAAGSADAFLQRADHALPRDASVLLVTPGVDVRHREYTTFHRALYWLTPRSVWWLTSVAPDSSWESRWWISGPLTGETILRVAAEKRVTHLLTWDSVEMPAVGSSSADLPSGAILALASDDIAASTPLTPSAEPMSRPSFWLLRSSAALIAILLLGDVVAAALTRSGFGREVTGIERAALAWTVGSGLTSLIIFWLAAAGAALDRQVMIISLVALIGWVAVRSNRSAHRRPGRQHVSPHAANTWAARAISCVAVAVLGACLLMVSVAAIGQPLTVWDSWVLWGMRARTMFVENGISPAIYNDPSRLVTLPTYPLLLPTLEAWTYIWLGSADDRLAGAVVVPFYVALPVVVYASLRRRAAGVDLALLASATVAALPALVGVASGVLADLPVALFTLVAAIYLVEWLEHREAHRLIVVALSAGCLPWTKREGAVIVVVLALATLIVGRGRRAAWIGASVLCGSALLLAGPWYAFVARYGLNDPQFEAVTLAHLLANIGRLPSIVWHALTTLFSPAAGWVWPAAGAFALLARPAGALARPSAILPLAAVLYVATMTSVYFFSAYAPYQQHIVASFPRLIAHVTALPLLWIAYHGTPRH